MRLADDAGLSTLAQNRLSVPTDKGANAGAKIASLVSGMTAGADSINDMDLLRQGGMSTLFDRIYAPSTLGSFLRTFTFGHVRQLDAVASRFLVGLARQAPNLVPAPAVRSGSGYVFVDVDDTIIEVHGHKKQGVGFGYSKVRGLNALLATVTTPDSAPVVVAQRLRRGSCGSPRGAARLIADAITTTRRLPGMNDQKILVRADSANSRPSQCQRRVDGRGGCGADGGARRASRSAAARSARSACMALRTPARTSEAIRRTESVISLSRSRSSPSRPASSDRPASVIAYVALRPSTAFVTSPSSSSFASRG